MDQPQQKPEKKIYFLEKISDSSQNSTLYIVTEGKNGQAVLMVDKESIKRITSDGWSEESHQDFKKAELSNNNKILLLFYQNKSNPVEIPIPKSIKIIPQELTHEILDSVINQMILENKSYIDMDAEYYHGTNISYCYDPEKKMFKETQMDVIAASFCNDYYLTKENLKEKLFRCASYYDLKKQGFNI